ncbi:hypothetical protein ACMFMF_005951 [Clarireedia jacksonii]
MHTTTPSCTLTANTNKAKLRACRTTTFGYSSQFLLELRQLIWKHALPNPQLVKILVEPFSQEGNQIDRILQPTRSGNYGALRLANRAETKTCGRGRNRRV